MSSTTLEYLRTEKLGACSRCPLCSTRRWIVFGEGDPEASIVLVGSAPKAAEDITGKPFVGASGVLLDKILARVGLSRDAIYITNVLKCFTGGRDPEDLEVTKCLPFLHAQLGIIKPKVIVSMGKLAGNLLVESDTPQAMKLLASMNPWAYNNQATGFSAPVVALQHPTELLQQIEAQNNASGHLQAFIKGLNQAKDISER